MDKAMEVAEQVALNGMHKIDGRRILDIDKTTKIIADAIREATAEAQKKLDNVAEALDSAHTVFVHDARDWCLLSRDAWLYGLFVGWDDCYDDIFSRHPRWKQDGIDRLRRLRSAVAAVYDIDKVMAKEIEERGKG